MPRLHFDILDNRILKMLSGNARKPFLEIARENGVSGAAVHQRIHKLTHLGVIKSFETIIEPSAVGYETSAYIGFMLNDATNFDLVIEKLKEIPEVVQCNITAGSYDILAKVVARNNADLFELIREKLSFGLGRTETLIVFKEVFSRPIPIRDISPE